MRSTNYLAIVAVACALMWLASCGGGGGLSAIDGAAQTGGEALGDAWSADGDAGSTTVDINDLAGLLEIWKETAAGDGEWSEENRFRSGRSYEWELPHYKTNSVSGYQYLVYKPVAAANGAAYAFYQFPLAGYDGDPVIHFDWEVLESSGVETELWVGLVNLDELDWDWFKGSLTDPVDPESLAPYLSEDGNLRMAVLLFGEGEFQLNWLRVGGNLAPVLVLRTDPVEGPMGECLIDATLCNDLDGEITTCEFDLDGDGTYETDRSEYGFAWPEFNTPGVKTVGVRLTDDTGATSTAQAELTINDWIKEDLFEIPTDLLQITAYDFDLISDQEGNSHIVFYQLPAGGGSELNRLCHGTDQTGEWVIEDIADDLSWPPATPQILVRNDGSLLVAAVDWPSGADVAVRFFQPEAGSWSELPEMTYPDAGYYANLFEVALDSQDYPHVVIGCNGHGEGSGAFDYCYYDGDSWVNPLSYVPTTSVKLAVNQADSPVMLLNSYAIHTLFSCLRVGDGFQFSALAYDTGVHQLELNSQDYLTYSAVNTGYYDGYLVSFQFYLFNQGHPDVSLIQYTQNDIEKTTLTNSDYILTGNDVAHITYSWSEYYYETKTSTGFNAYTSGARDYVPECFYITDLPYLIDEYQIVVDAENQPMIVALRLNIYYEDEEHSAGHDLVLFHK